MSTSIIDFSNKHAFDLLSKGALLLDIRTQEEFCQGHIKGAILVPTPAPPLSDRELKILQDQLWWLLSQKLKSKTHPIVVYCRKGVRASIAKKIIKDLGYPNVLAWGGVAESPMKQLFDDGQLICKCPHT